MKALFEKYKTKAEYATVANSLLASAFLFLSVFDYITIGFSFEFLFCWSLGIFMLLSFYSKIDGKARASFTALEEADIYPLLAIILVFAVLYLAMPGSYPIQMNSDEVSIRDAVREFINHLPQINPLGPSWYAGFPFFVHLLLGWGATALGGISIDHLRSVHALAGFLCVVFAFIFFRTLGLTRPMAVCATCILGFNHSFFTISRLVSQYSFGPFVEVVALSLSYRGVMSKSKFLTCIGGLAVGATFYVHPPARIVVFIFLLAYAFSRWSFSRWKECCAELLPFVIGFTVAAFPMLWSIKTASPDLFTYQRGQLLVLPEGRSVEATQVGAHSELEGVWINIQQGIFAYNYPKNDCSNIYTNLGFGFVDPLTGAMIWIGLLYLLIEWKERSAHRAADILCVTGFLFLWLLFSFVITFAPSYGRMTVSLPFVAYLAAYGILGTTCALKYCVSELPQSWRERLAVCLGNNEARIENLSMGTLLAAIILLNFYSLWKFTREALTQGDRYVATFRAAEKLEGDPRWHLVISGNDDYPYFENSPDYEEIAWTDSRNLPGRVFVIPPPILKAEIHGKKLDQKMASPFILFLTRKLWQEIRIDFTSKHPAYKIREMVPDGSLLAIVVE